MKRIWAISGGLIPPYEEWPDVFHKLKGYAPDEIYVLSNTEVDMEGNWGLFLDFLETYKNKYPTKVISVITPHLQGTEIRKNIFTEQSYAMVESVLPLFLNNLTNAKSINHFPEFRNIDKVFSCYMFRPDESRGRLIDSLVDNNLLKDGHVTYHNTSVNTHEGFKFYKKEPLRIDSEQYSKDSDRHFVTPASYHNSFIDLVPEASFLPNMHFLTEKTIRAILHKKPFVSLASPGFHSCYLKDFFKLELYDECIDYSFDNEYNLQTRIDCLVQNIIDLSKMSTRQLKALLLKLEPKLRHNADRLEYIYKTPELLVPKSMRHLLDPNEEYDLQGLHQVSFFDYIKKVRMNSGKFPY